VNTPKLSFIALLSCLLFCVGCSSTKLISSGKAPGATVDLERLNKVLVVARIKDPSDRKLAEDKMASYHQSFRASYMELGDKEILGDERKYRSSMKRRGFDGILTIRFIGQGTEKTYVQGTYVPGTYIPGTLGRTGIYNSGYYLPGYYRTDVKQWLRADVYSLQQDKFLWAGITETTNPSGVDKTVGEVLGEVRDQMIKDKFISVK